jgi:hypothetical protein
VDGLLSGLAEQTCAPLELRVVDDGSEDDTAARVQAWRSRLPGLTFLAGAPLPPGWVGKCWALNQAVQDARGELLLFLDADVKPSPDFLSSLVAHFVRERLELLSCFPCLELGSFAEKLVLPAFHSLLLALYPLGRARRFANGQCLLVSRARYNAVGGHAAVAGSVLEDVHLAQGLVDAGARAQVAQAQEVLGCRMYSGWQSLAEGLGKNAVAGFQSGGARSAFIGLRQALVAFLPWILAGLVALGGRGISSVPLALAAVGITLPLVTSSLLAHQRYRSPWFVGLLLPLGLATYFALAARAFINLRRGRALVWKGRLLPQ